MAHRYDLGLNVNSERIGWSDGRGNNIRLNFPTYHNGAMPGMMPGPRAYAPQALMQQGYTSKDHPYEQIINMNGPLDGNGNPNFDQYGREVDPQGKLIGMIVKAQLDGDPQEMNAAQAYAQSLAKDDGKIHMGRSSYGYALGNNQVFNFNFGHPDHHMFNKGEELTPEELFSKVQSGASLIAQMQPAAQAQQHGQAASQQSNQPTQGGQAALATLDQLAGQLNQIPEGSLKDMPSFGKMMQAFASVNGDQFTKDVSAANPAERQQIIDKAGALYDLSFSRLDPALQAQFKDQEAALKKELTDKIAALPSAQAASQQQDQINQKTRIEELQSIKFDPNTFGSEEDAQKAQAIYDKLVGQADALNKAGPIMGMFLRFITMVTNAISDTPNQSPEEYLEDQKAHLSAEDQQKLADMKQGKYVGAPEAADDKSQAGADQTAAGTGKDDAGQKLAAAQKAVSDRLVADKIDLNQPGKDLPISNTTTAQATQMLASLGFDSSQPLATRVDQFEQTMGFKDHNGVWDSRDQAVYDAIKGGDAQLNDAIKGLVGITVSNHAGDPPAQTTPAGAAPTKTQGAAVGA